MNIEFKPFEDFYEEYNFDSNPILLIINNEIKEAYYEKTGCQFYIYSGLYDETGTRCDYISEDDSRITHWAYARVK